MKQSLREAVCDQIGAELPQLPIEEYDERVEEELENMSAKRLLELLSYTFDWSHLKKE